MFSSLCHVAAVVLIIGAIDSTPEGAGNNASGDVGIVLSDEEPGSQSPPVQEESPPAATQVQAAEFAARITPVAAPTSAPVNPTATAPAATSPRVAQAPGGSGGEGNYGDGKASVKVFGVEGKGSRFIYVFDRSSSMEGTPLATAKQQLIASLDSLSSVHQFHIIFFNQQVRHSDLSGGGRRTAFATDRTKKLATRFVGGITADGGTDRYSALRAAIQMQPDVIFFLTDADDPMPASELKDIAELTERVGATISTIEFGRGASKPTRNFLTELARITGGQYGYVDTETLRSPAR
jgi:Mg-chelatase subunit ChlD